MSAINEVEILLVEDNPNDIELISPREMIGKVREALEK